MPIRRFAFVLVPALVALLGCGDGSSTDAASAGGGDVPGCTSKGCGPAFFVSFERAGAWAAGSYTVDVTLDGTLFACTATLPLSCDAPSPCPEGAPFYVLLSGCALDTSQHKLGGVEIHQGNAPSSVKIEVAHEGTPLGSGTFTPAYTTSEPNGPDCGPTCEGAPEAKLDLL